MNISSLEPPYPNGSPAYSPSNTSENAASPAYIPRTEISDNPQDYYKRRQLDNGIVQVEPKYNFPEDLGYYFMNLSDSEKIEVLNKPYDEQVNYLTERRVKVLQELADKPTPNYNNKTNYSNILEVNPPEEKEEVVSSPENSGSSEKIIVTIPESTESSSEKKSSNETRKIIL
jgi:hypothetical protein